MLKQEKIRQQKGGRVRIISTRLRRGVSSSTRTAFYFLCVLRQGLGQCVCVSVCVCVYGTARCCQEMFVHGRVQFVCVHRTRPCRSARSHEVSKLIMPNMR